MFITNNLPVIQFTARPKLVVARYDGQRPSACLLPFFGEEAKILPLENVWPDFLVDSTQTVAGQTTWVIISLGLFINDNALNSVSPETIGALCRLLDNLVDKSWDGEEFLPYLTMPHSLVKPHRELASQGLREQFRRFVARLEQQHDG